MKKLTIDMSKLNDSQMSVVIDLFADVFGNEFRDLTAEPHAFELSVNTLADSKTAKISRIKEIIAEWGATTTAELEADHSPCISSSGTNRMNVSTLVEGFNSNNVKVVTYNNETEIAEDEIPYEDLSEDVIDDILDLLEDYDTNNEKTYKRCQD